MLSIVNGRISKLCIAEWKIISTDTNTLSQRIEEEIVGNSSLKYVSGMLNIIINRVDHKSNQFLTKNLLIFFLF